MKIILTSVASVSFSLSVGSSGLLWITCSRQEPDLQTGEDQELTCVRSSSPSASSAPPPSFWSPPRAGAGGSAESCQKRQT